MTKKIKDNKIINSSKIYSESEVSITNRQVHQKPVDSQQPVMFSETSPNNGSLHKIKLKKDGPHEDEIVMVTESDSSSIPQ